MSSKKQKTFSSVQEIMETYFPSYAKKHKDSMLKETQATIDDLSMELAEEFKVNLKRKLRSRVRSTS